MSLPNELQRHLVGDHRAKGVASKIEWSRGLMNEHQGGFFMDSAALSRATRVALDLELYFYCEADHRSDEDPP